MFINPEGVESRGVVVAVWFNPFRVDELSGMFTQGGARRATLGCKIESLQDSKMEFGSWCFSSVWLLELGASLFRR
jgi:hypothetical protein